VSGHKDEAGGNFAEKSRGDDDAATDLVGERPGDQERHEQGDDVDGEHGGQRRR
jgi:hypothetical protein